MKKLVALCVAGCMAVTLGACGGSGTSESISVTRETTPEPASDLTGVWTQIEAGDSYQQATIQGNTIEINWVDEGGTSALYWAGSFTAPTTSDEPYTWTSINDTSKTSGALMASSDETKDFTYEDGRISYSVSVMGVTTTMQLEKTGEADEASNSVTSGTAPAAASETTFADDVLTTDGYTIAITDYRVIQPGETGNEYGDVPVIAFWYDTTNTGSGSDINASSAWIMVFEAIQDNDPNVVNTLNMGMLPDSQFLDSQTQTIKEGGTVSNAIAYELDDTTTPVTLMATDMMGNEYGRQDFLIEEEDQVEEAEEGLTTTPQEFAKIVEDFLNQGGAAGSTAVADGDIVTVNYLFAGGNLDVDTVSEDVWAEFEQSAMDYYQSLEDTASALGAEVSIILNYKLQGNSETTLLTIQDGSVTYDAVA